MKFKTLIFLYFIFCSNCYVFAQNNLDTLSKNIFNNNIESSQRSNSMIELLNIYINSHDANISNKIEAILIKTTNYSSSLFFHEFELKLPDFIENNIIDKKKGARLYLILSKKEKNETDYRYYAFVEKYKENGNLIGIKKVDCNKTISIEKLLKRKDYKNANNYYYNLILYCNENTDKIEKIKKYYFLVK